MLEQFGVDAYIRGEYLQGGFGDLPVAGVISVCVQNVDETRAREILAEWEAGAMEINED